MAFSFPHVHCPLDFSPHAVPGSELDKINQTFSGLLSFSRSFKYSTAAPRWAGAEQYTFSAMPCHAAVTFGHSSRIERAALRCRLPCRLANWGKAAAVRFAPSGERFAAVGEGGVVATWRLDAPSRQVV